MIVADIVRRSAPSVREHTVLTVAADALVESGLGSLPVLDSDGLLSGVVSEGDRCGSLSAPGASPGVPPGRAPPHTGRTPTATSSPTS